MNALPADEMLRIEHGDACDYRTLAGHHYKSGLPYAPTAVYAMRHDGLSAVGRYSGRTSETVLVGVLVMNRPQLCCSLRDAATSGRYRGLKVGEAAALLNREVRCIARVIIDPRYRGLGLAVRLVRYALGCADTPYVEALAAMGRVNPFFERAGMVRYDGPPRPADARLLDALAELNWPRTLLASGALLEEQIAALSPAQRVWIESEFRRWYRSAAFMQRRRSHAAGLDEMLELARVRLLAQCVYYLHHDPDRRPA